MKQTSLIVEFLIIGFIDLIIGALFLMIILDVKSFDYLKELNNYKEILIISGTILSYIFGVITYRVGQILNLRLIKKIFRKPVERQEWYSENYVLVYQFGSQNVLERVFYGESMLRLFKSVSVLFPILSFEVLYFCYNFNQTRLGIVLSIALIVIAIVSFISHRIQTRNHRKFIELTAEIITQHNN